VIGDEGAAGEAGVLVLAEEFVFVLELAAVEGFADEEAEFVGTGEGFAEVVFGAEFHGFDGTGDGAETGDHDDGGGGRVFLDPAEDGEAIAIGEFEIRDDEMELTVAAGQDGVGNGAGDGDGVAFAGEDGLEEGAEAGVVIDDEDVFGVVFRHCGGEGG
jgi:hypothetical protein